MLASGTKLGPYEVLAPLGAGGMGEVYRARDTKLGRDVAIKVLPEAFASDKERLARFQREAKLLASLNHANIASIYGLEDSGDTHALVMELASGPTLADRIRQGPIPVEEAIPIARQIAEALEYAHERGVVHRDLKPANIKISRDDSVKILDFGLAKAVQGEAEATDIGNSPTISQMATESGILLGTAAYMSPEQAKTKPVDRRADIWAFGCVLYEMLTGKKAFPGETVPDTLGAIMRGEPDWSLLPQATPMRVRVLLQRCLQKDPKQRLRDIGDARISLDEILTGAPEAAPGIAASQPTWRRALPWAAGLLVAVIIGFVAWVLKPAPPAPPPRVLRYEIFPPEKTRFGTEPANNTAAFAVSPDGLHVAFAAAAPGSPAQLWIRDLDSTAPRPLPDTEGATAPFWSPDSRSLAFETGGKLERVDISGGPPQVICAVGRVIGGAWNQDGLILFGSYEGLMQVSAAGGSPSALIKAAAGQFVLEHPSFLPDGRHFLYLSPTQPGNAAYIGSIDSAGRPKAPVVLVTNGSVSNVVDISYVPSQRAGPGRIVFLQADGRLVAQAFDASREKLEGDPITVAQGVDTFTASNNGILAYTGGNGLPFQLTWFDRNGKVLGTVGEAGAGVLPLPAISPDGDVVAVPLEDAAGGIDLWLYDVRRGVRSRFTFDGKNNELPVWSSDGNRIAYVSFPAGIPAIYEKSVDGMGQAERFDARETNLVPLDWSRDGRYLVEGYGGNPLAIWILRLSPQSLHSEGKSLPYVKSDFNAMNARLAPNTEWLAYDSDETGRDEIFVQTFPRPGGKWQVSTDGGTRPVWSRDGKELYFIGLDGTLMAVEITSGPARTFQAGPPKALFDPHIGGDRLSTWDISKDRRLLIPVAVGQSSEPITVVANWTSALSK
jgi:eukaryotic-like serine/threonine-protein kinase